MNLLSIKIGKENQPTQPDLPEVQVFALSSLSDSMVERESRLSGITAAKQPIVYHSASPSEPKPSSQAGILLNSYLAIPIQETRL